MPTVSRSVFLMISLKQRQSFYVPVVIQFWSSLSRGTVAICNMNRCRRAKCHVCGLTSGSRSSLAKPRGM